MEYRVTLPVAAPELQRFIKVLRAEDPAAMLDRATEQGPLRVDTFLKEDEILSLLVSAGIDADSGSIRRLPSVCCGGCGG